MALRSGGCDPAELDAMESVRLRVLHLRLSDNEGFRVERRRYPRLTDYPSSGGQFYPQADIRALVVYPEMGGGPASLTRRRGPDTMKAALDPCRASTYRFLAGLLGWMAALFPHAAMRVAGDDMQGYHWLAKARRR